MEPRDIEIPWIINLELTNLCQLECVFCDHPIFKKQMRLGYMQESLLQKIMLDIEQDWVALWHLSKSDILQKSHSRS